MTAIRGLRGRGHFASIRAWRCEGRSGPLRVLAAPSRGEASLGLATPGMRGAVPRNRLRRRLRAASAAVVAEARRSGGYDLIVTAAPPALTIPFTELSRHVERAAGTALERAVRTAAGRAGAAAPRSGPGLPLGTGGGERG